MAGRKNRMERLARLNTFKYPKRKARPPSPREEASFLQVLFMSWLIPLLKTGMKREITEKDLYPVLFEDQSEHIADKLEIMWGDHWEQCKIRGKKPSLFRMLWKAFSIKFFFFGIFSLAEETVFRMIQVIAFGYVLDYFEGNYLTTLTGTILFGVGGILLGSISFLVSFHWSIFNLHHVCTHIRIGLSSLVYRKILHLNQKSLRESTLGQIMTIIASDLHRFDRKHIQVNYIWIAPIHLLVVVYVLYFHYQYGVTSLIGLCVLIFFAMIQYAMASRFTKMRQKRVDSSDLRIRAVVEIINAFYTIKFHCWEKFFGDKAMDNRKKEIKILRATMFLRLLNTAIGFVVTKMSVFMTLLLSFVMHDSIIDSKRIFVTLVLYEHVRVNSMILFPQAVHDVAELIASCRRIEAFLSAEELEPPSLKSAMDHVKTMGDDKKPRIEVTNLSCRWLDEDRFQLTDINFTVGKGEMIVVAGPVASGKSTLISAILGELTPTEGRILVVGRIAYVPQEPVLFPGSIRRNIIFGYGINLKWYEEVVRMCELEADFKTFPKGDQSLTETTKMTLAQQARINIARALYANADVYLLDDPLQSMDLKHYRFLLDTVIHGALADKVVLLVTHQVQVLENASNIMLMYEGKVYKHGTYKQFRDDGIEFLKDMGDDDEFDSDSGEENLSDDISSGEEEDPNFAMLVQENVVTNLIKPRDNRRNGSIHFLMDKETRIKQVAQTGTTMEFGRTSRKSPTSLDGKDDGKDGFGRTDSVLAHMTILANDGGAYDSRDRIEEPRKISLRLYYDFLRIGSSRTTLIILLLMFILSQGMYTFTDFWIEHWAVSEEKQRQHRHRGSKGEEHMESRKKITIVYCASVLSIMVISFARSILVFKICMKASTQIFKTLLDATIQSKLHHFEKTCAGHAINRLSKDMVIIDDLIPPTLLEVLGVLFEIAGALFILAYASPWFFIPSLAFIFLSLIIYRIYHLTAADLKRIEGNARTPVYSHLNKTLQGVTVIRAFGQEQAFSMIFDRLQDNHTSSWYLFLSTQAWLSVTVDLISVILIGFISVSFFYLDPATIRPAAVGLTISKMIELSILSQFAASEMSNAETQMISVERVLEFAHPKESGQFENFDGPAAPEFWPSKGEIKLENLCIVSQQIKLRKPKNEFNNINLTIEGGQWVGIVGKSGSGKTTLLNVLFRIADIKGGKVWIDGIDISTLGLHHLRSKISMIPQIPCMYQATLRQNVDPLSLYSDSEIWDALREATLFNTVQQMEKGLDSNVNEFGMNFSTGQRQFICLARAILEKNNIICCDEPTASLDGYSQCVLSQKLKEHFGKKTLIFVAHRINSIINFDRILVLDAGQVVDDGSPLELITKTKGPFQDLIRNLGQKRINELIEQVKEAQLLKSMHTGGKSARRKSIKLDPLSPELAAKLESEQTKQEKDKKHK